MPRRRDFLKQGLALGAAAAQAALVPAALAGTRQRLGASIRSAMRRDDTIVRLGGLGDGYKMTVGPGGKQFVVVNDGPGWADPPQAFYNTRLWTIAGGPRNASFAMLGGYPDINRSTRPENAPHYFGHGILSVHGRLYQFLSTLDAAEDRPRHWAGSKLIYSDDGGASWRNQDGTMPVVWEDWKEQSPERFAFFQEADGCFSLLAVLQQGPDYGANRDGFIYVYGLNGNVDGRMNELVMFRVKIASLLDRRAYQFFGGLRTDGSARWVTDIAARRPVHSFPRGWVNYTNLFPGDLVVESWLPSVVYNEPLGLYMMSSAGIGCAPDGTEFGKASYLGLWVAAKPWGPWRQIHEETAWTPGGDAAARAYAPQIAPAWIAPDGRSFWLVWADLKGIRELGKDEALMDAALEKARDPRERTEIETAFLRRYIPGFSFSAQRVDLIVG